MLRRALPALLLTVVLAACGSGDESPAASGDPTTTSESTTTTTTTTSSSSTTTTETPPDCSAGGQDPPADQPELPEAVAATRAAIIEAALACDLDRLEELATQGDGEFNYSFGAEGPAGFAGHLREREAAGEEVLRILVETFALPFQTQSLPDGDFVSWERPDPLGYRVGITETGDWMYFVAGD